MNKVLMICVMLLAISFSATAQKQQVRIESFTHDPMDQAAKLHPKQDANGDLYALIKVRPSAQQFKFNFGLMKSVDGGVHEDESWIYVQKNARKVSVTADGYEPIRNIDLGQTLSAGETYIMLLSFDEVVSIRKHSLSKQMVQFVIHPADAKAVVMIRRNDGDGSEQLFGTADDMGYVADNLDFGTYAYRVQAKNCETAEGILTVSSSKGTLVENVQLRSNTGQVRLSVAAGADIYVDNLKRGTGQWTGTLAPGEYLVEARQEGHVSTSQRMTVVKGETLELVLPNPVPITGFVSVKSTPMGASIFIDGQEVGKSPMNVNDVLIGSHQVTLKADGYKDYTATVVVKEGEMASVSTTMEKGFTPSTFTVNGVSFVMIPVEGGTFQMGSTDIDDAYDDAKPIHSVTLSSYFIGQTEVTQELWQAVMGNNPSNFKGDKLPVDCHSWENSLAFIAKLNQQTGMKFRLPTEAEWEFAARGGRQSKGYKYSGSNTIDDVAWYEDNSGNKPHAVGTKRPNELGLYDMSGNVWEFCQDWYDGYSSSSQTNPTGASSGSKRVSRGSCWYQSARSCRVIWRGRSLPTTQGLGNGLRLALSSSQ
ncbi:MAG: SUMF1/EgtB/PvdO family nonheme iron enzyme [Bacteroidaceae bacterium]|nr:SUMF1/EgtB/PvdO family nonheme iron enzyme [Bacteroidaceae bacterium]